DAFGRYLAGCVRAGADVVQLFDSWVGTLSVSDYREFAAPYLARVLQAVDVPRIHFATGDAHLLEERRAAGGDVIGVDWRLPLDEITEAQRAGLERELELPVFVGMKHWRPRIAEAVEAALAGGAETIVGLVLAPHYSRLSIAGYRERLEGVLDGRAELVFIESWHDYPPFLDALAARVRGFDGHVVFTAHSLPERILRDGDPYRDQLLETSRLVAERAGVAEWSFAFQSASPTGEPWLGPDT